MHAIKPSTKALLLAASLIALSACSKQEPASGTIPAPAKQAELPAPSAPRVGVNLPDFTSLIEAHGPAVVNISTTQTVNARSRRGDMPLPQEDDPLFDFFRRFMPQQPRNYQAQSLGSGFIIASDGTILTNAHVVADADEVTVRLTDKREFKAKVLGSDKRTDVAVIKINADKLPIVTLGQPAQLRVGEWVVAIGSPFGFDNSVTAGIVSAKGRSLPEENYVPFIQTDVPINPGNSGGPLFNMRGEVVGINSQIYSRSGGYMGISFAIPIDVAMNVAKQLQQNGKVSRGRIGVQIQPLSQELAQSFGLKSTDGALVSMVEPGSPAARAGMQPGDVILKFNGEPVKGSSELPQRTSGQQGAGADLASWPIAGVERDSGGNADRKSRRQSAGRASNGKNPAPRPADQRSGCRAEKRAGHARRRAGGKCRRRRRQGRRTGRRCDRRDQFGGNAVGRGIQQGAR